MSGTTPSPPTTAAPPPPAGPETPTSGGTSLLDALADDVAYLIDGEPRLARTGDPPRIELLTPGFGGLVHLILGQQVSIEAADSMFARLGVTLGSITPEGLLALDDDTMRACGFTAMKASYARALAGAVLGGFDLTAVAAMETEAAIATLTAFRGVGRWTAECYLLFCEGRRDVFPAGDLALRVGWQEIAGLAEPPSESELRDIAMAWTPRRSAAAHLIWDSYLRRRGRR